jgi:DEAD/DEAH box helicase domain-containing protein
MLSTLATLYKKLKLDTNENLGWGKIRLPELELHTTAYWVAFEAAAVAGWRRDVLDAALVGAGRAMQTVGSVLLMSDPRDLGLVAQVRSPHAERPVIYLYDGVPGGVGLSARLFERHAELVAGALDLVRGCPCDEGCPACTGPRLEMGGDGKVGAEALLALLAAEPAATTAAATAAVKGAA